MVLTVMQKLVGVTEMRMLYLLKLEMAVHLAWSQLLAHFPGKATCPVKIPTKMRHLQSQADSPVPSELSSVSFIDIDSVLGLAPNAHPPALKTYKLVGNNLDRNVCPCDMHSDYQGHSLHYFHLYAVRDHVDLTNVSDVQVLLT